MKSYLKHKILNLIDIKELTAVEYLDFEGKYKGYLDKHDFWELCFVEKGEVKLTVEEETKTVAESTLILIPPDKSHTYYSETGKDNKAFVVCFQCLSQALNPLAEIKFELNSENHNCMKKIISESLATFRMNENELLEVTDNPAIGGQQMIILHLECLLINLLRLLASKEKSDI
ncbi:MAG: AraC family ligand binding domain-containing protein, partial [Clostridia bacterium]|nr:AraC family ligand binding domain-containing protein [Clostridia bacterium]